MILVLHY